MIDHTRGCVEPAPYRVGLNSAQWKSKGYLLCNRPAGHDGNHIHSAKGGRLQAVWTRAGQPVRAWPAAMVVGVPDLEPAR